MPKEIDWEKIRQGDKSVFNQAFDTYFHPLCAFVLPYLNDHQLVQDLVVDCFVKLWEEHKTLDIKSSLQNYLVTVAKNSAISYLRKKQPEFTVLDKHLYSLADEEHDPLGDVSLQNKLYQAIGKLPEQRRLILKMAAFEGKSYQQIADELTISVNTVKTQMSRAYKFLKEELNVSKRTIHFMLSL